MRTISDIEYQQSDVMLINFITIEILKDSKDLYVQHYVQHFFMQHFFYVQHFFMCNIFLCATFFYGSNRHSALWFCTGTELNKNHFFSFRNLFD